MAAPTRKRSKQKKRRRMQYPALPDDCWAEILSRTSPRVACRVAAVSKSFKLIADSEAVWEQFLPLDYRQLIKRAVSPVAYDSKKQLYLHLSKSHILLDHGNLSFQLSKKNGNQCYMLGARELYIRGQDNPRCWRWNHENKSRFSEVAKLEKIDRLEIRAKIATTMLPRKCIYVAYLVYQLNSQVYNGFKEPGKTMVTFSGKENGETGVYIAIPDPYYRYRYLKFPSYTNKRPHKRKDGWSEIRLGEFYRDEGDDDGEVVMSFNDTPYKYPKNGITVEGIEIRPKTFAKKK